MTVSALIHALHRVVTGDQDPPRPWAYLSGLGITEVKPVSGAWFTVTIDDEQYVITVSKAMPPELCEARIWHGPGHQSSTPCHLTGEHTVHEARYGEFSQYATWRSRPDGKMTFTGAFDEPPRGDDE